MWKIKHFLTWLRRKHRKRLTNLANEQRKTFFCLRKTNQQILPRSLQQLKGTDLRQLSSYLGNNIMFSLQEGGVSAHFNGQIFGSCPIKESNSGIWLTKVKKPVSLLILGMSNVQGMFFSTFLISLVWQQIDNISKTYFIRRTLS